MSLTVNFNNPVVTDTRTAVLQMIRDANVAQARMYDGDTLTNAPIGAIRWSAAAGRFQIWSGTVWNDLSLGPNLANLNASNLGSGTVPDARFPATLPAVSGINLTSLNASNLGSGTVPPARVSGAYTGITDIGALPGLSFSLHRPRVRGDITTFEPVAANASGIVSVAPRGTGDGATLELFALENLGNTSVGVLQMGSVALDLNSTKNGTGVFRPIRLWTSGLSRLEVDVNGNVTINGPLSGTTATFTGLVRGGGSSGAAFRIGDDCELHDISVANQIGIRGAQSANEATAQWGAGGPVTGRRPGHGQFAISGGALTYSASIAFSATPTISAHTSNYFEFGTLTGNVTSMTINDAAVGQAITIRFVQDGTGNRTVALPAGAVVSGSINPAANSVSFLQMIWVGAGRFEGSWARTS